MSVTGFQNTTFGFGNIQIDEPSGKIFSTDITGTNQCIGYTKKAYKELQKIAEDAVSKTEEYKKKADEYEQKLIEAGLLQKPLSPEEQFNSLVSLVTQLGSSVQTLTNDMSCMKEQLNELSSSYPNRKGAVSK